MTTSIKIRQTNNAVQVSGTDIDLCKTFTCGQCFRWYADGDGWTGVVRGQVLHAVQTDDGFILENTTVSQFQSIWADYFDLNKDYKKLIAPQRTDPFVERCFQYGAGIRILHQEPFETILTFILSANNNIKRISKIIEALCREFGSPVQYKDKILYSFPTPVQLAGVDADDLQPLHAGYRDKYVLDAVRKLQNPQIFNKINSAKTAEARNILCGIKGIGPKVCDCILLFAFQRYEVFPKDVWIKRIIHDVYADEFEESNLGKYAGIIQQYFFYYGRADKNATISYP